jgi:hypothetical protein
MWILAKTGFYSITKKPSHLNPDGPAVFNIRGRDKDDLKRLAELVSPDLAKRPVVHEYAHSDYPYRVYLNTQEEMDAVMAKLSALIDYENFKDTIKATPHQKAKIEPYEEFWGLLEKPHRQLRPSGK